MVKTLVKNDLVYMRKDPMMWLIIMMPIAMISFYYIVMNYFLILVPYKGILKYMFITMAGSLSGIVFGLRILDEKDEQLLSFYAVTPLTLRGYFLYRAVLSFGISTAVSAMISVGIMGKIVFSVSIYIGGLSVLITLGMGSLAKNKIQGMILAKLIGLLVALPCIRQLGENRLDSILIVLPWDLLYKILALGTWQIKQYLLYIIVVCMSCIILYKRQQV